MKYIVFDSTRDNLFGSSPRDYRHDVFIMNADGTNQRDLTFTFGTDDEYSRHNSMEPSVSSDSRRIAFSSNKQGRHSIYIMMIDDEGITRLTDPSKQDPPGIAPERLWGDYEPRWSPDGNYLSYYAI